ncbi:MAG: hypothetical protein AAGL92_06120 [Pseudomonadota bacterium]
MRKGKTPEFKSTDPVTLAELRDWHEIRVTCRACGREASLFKSHFAKRGAIDMTLKDVMTRSRCSSCGAKGKADWAVFRMNRY